jgi:hypothetical protein
MIRFVLLAGVLFLGSGCVNWADRRAEVFAHEGTSPVNQRLIEEGRLYEGMTFLEACVAVKSYGSPVGFNGNPGIDRGNLMIAGVVTRVVEIPNLRLTMYFQNGRLVSYVQIR